MRNLAVFALLLLTAPALRAQVDVRSAVHFERYSFDELSISSVSQFTLPITATSNLGSWGNLMVTTGLVSVGLQSRGTTSDDERVSGALDTEARLTVNIVPGRFMWLANVGLPTGIQSFTESELSLLTVISRDIIGFTASDLGTGGYVGSGVVGAFPSGQMAVGVAATFQRPFSYQPIKNDPRTLRPGSEFRFRAGLEGPVGPRTYLRAAGILAVRQNDAINDTTVNGVGNRLTGYVSLNQGVGPSSATFYLFDVFRGGPQIERTAIGSGLLPRGNLFALGTRWAFRLSEKAELSPNAEYRLSHAAPDTVNTSLQSLGNSFRLGADLRQQLSDRAALVIQGSALTGRVKQFGGLPTDIGMSGFHLAVHVEVRP